MFPYLPPRASFRGGRRRSVSIVPPCSCDVSFDLFGTPLIREIFFFVESLIPALPLTEGPAEVLPSVFSGPITKKSYMVLHPVSFRP